MTSMKLVSKLLKFKGFKAVSLWFEGKGENDIVVAVKPHKNGCRCPQCGRRGQIVRTMPPRRWRDVRVCGRTVWLLHAPREIRCPTHGRRVEAPPWAEPGARVTYRLEYLLLRCCQAMPQKAAAQLLGMPSSTLSDILHRIIGRVRKGHSIRDLKTMGIDEISYAKGHKYATLVYDLDRSCVVWVGRGKARQTIDRFFENALSAYQKTKIKWACCDMSETFIGAIQQHCPNTLLILDRFHVVKALNNAVDEVRKEQWREACPPDRKALKGLRWLLYRHSATRSREDTSTLKALEKANQRIYRAWRLKDEFEQLWEYKAPWAATRFLKTWTTAAMRSRLEPLKKFVTTVRKHADGILAFVETHLTNAVSEGLNRIVRMIKNRASGFRDLDPFVDLIFLCVGDVDIPAQIPARFRTL
ncbi:MAG: ISL3 family transposase [Gemmatimonadetes bacterium]|jgi:transposase|nr:ISL3 family transposase [Gemmatimonadota bacterium]MBT7914541.1 ISL3 family transposase [Candidatus Bathyarchaeota archaeon]